MADQEYDKEQLRIMRNAFKAFDHDEKGIIEYNDVQTILEILGQKLDDKAIKALLKEVDKANSGKLDFGQFCKLASRFVEVEEDAPAMVSELKEAFRVYDKEGKGYLTVQTLRGILHELDDKLSTQDLDMIIEEIDADGSGTVDFDEFMQVMTGKNCHDLTINHRFVFEPSTSGATDFKYSTRTSHLYCPTRRLNLHRRIEWHFERFFQQLLDPFHTRSHTRISTTSTSNAPTVKHTTKTQVSSTMKAKQNSPSLTSKSSVCSKHTLTTACCHRPIYRPHFPKWVPILTLYREIIQNPFRQRARHLMITHK